MFTPLMAPTKESINPSVNDVIFLMMVNIGAVLFQLTWVHYMGGKTACHHLPAGCRVLWSMPAENSS